MMNREYSPEMRERALQMLAGTRSSHPTMMSAVRHVAGLLGMSPETLRLWHSRYEVDAGVKPGATTDAAAEIKRLQRRTPSFAKRMRSSRLRACLSRRRGECAAGDAAGAHACTGRARR